MRGLMKILIAPDSYKGTLSSSQVAELIESGLRVCLPDAEYCAVPIADGGEGTSAAIVAATKGKFVEAEVLNPLGEKIVACYGVSGDNKTAVVEIAAASGLPLVSRERRDALRATTYGTGQLIKDALDRGYRKIILGLGGSATTDGGVGMAQALGVSFKKASGAELGWGGGELTELVTIDCSGIDKRLRSTEILVACDVDILLHGAYGTAHNYARQKGATAAMIEKLDAGLKNYATVANAATGLAVDMVPGCGAAGGAAAGALYFFGAKLLPGAQLVLDAVDFCDKLAGSNLVITGEGRTDFQTLQGKAPVVVARNASRYAIPTLLLSGSLDASAQQLLNDGIFAAMFSTIVGVCDLQNCLDNAEVNLYNAARNIGALLAMKK